MNDLLMKRFVVDSGSSHVRRNPAREYAIDFNAVRGPSNSEGFGQLDDAAFAGGIVRHLRAAK